AKFQNEYDIQSQIGKGNYARVFSAIHKTTGKKFAVKCFEKQKLESQDKGMLSLYNEIKVMRNLTDHDNIIKLIEMYEGQNNLYLVMEIVEGTSLYDEIKKHSQTPFTDQEIKDIFKMLVDGIVYYSNKNIMHRDLKPENIPFAKKGNQQILKIVDFGLGTFADESPYMFPKCGTPGFVAPEIANLIDKTQRYSVICDVFSAGIIFYILLTGEAVFQGQKFNEVLRKNKECIIDFERKELENVSIDCKDLLIKMLEKDPSQAQKTISEVQEEENLEGKSCENNLRNNLRKF
ncbi:protein kinase domain protein, partial [Ichthyophthirius multifiliis]